MKTKNISNRLKITKSQTWHQRILITGGAGFIGSNLALKLLNKGYVVTILDNLSAQVHGKRANLNPKLKGKVKFINADVRNPLALKLGLADADVVVHLAAETGMGQSQYEISKYVSVNVQAQAELLQLMVSGRHQVRKLIIASSSRIYGEGMYHCEIDGVVYPHGRPKTQLEQGKWGISCPICGEAILPLPNKESALPCPTSIYAVSKLAQEHLALVFGNTYNIPTIVLRYQNVYGPGQALSNPYTGIISIFSARILNGQPPILYEDGNPTRDFVYIDDVVQATVLAIESTSPVCQVINVGSGCAINIKKIAGQLLKSMGSDLKIQISGEFRVGDVRNSSADISLARRILGYSPQYNIKDGLAKYVIWLRKHQRVKDRSKLASDQLKRLNLLGKTPFKIKGRLCE
jgi:dTDP-L-rhamnose 4-epimerase